MGWEMCSCQNCGPWLGNGGRSLRFSQQNLCKTPPSGEITMTSYPVCNKTSISRKPCIPDKMLLWNVIRKSWSLFQNASWKIPCSTPWWRNHDDVNCNASWAPSQKFEMRDHWSYRRNKKHIHFTKYRTSRKQFVNSYHIRLAIKPR